MPRINLCPFAPVDDYGFFTIGETIAVACYGEVWTDKDTNIIRMSEHLDLSDKLKAYRGWEDVRTVITYGWLKRVDQPPRLVPLTIYTEARYKKKQVYCCRGQFTDYRIFDSEVKIIAKWLTEPATVSPFSISTIEDAAFILERGRYSCFSSVAFTPFQNS